MNSLTLIGSCVDVGTKRWERFMKGTTKANGALIRKLIKKHLPDLYDYLALNFYNPQECSCAKKKGLLVYKHSSIEYFLRYE